MVVFPMSRRRALVPVLLAVVIAAACSSSDPATPSDDALSAARAGIPDRRPDIVGTVTSVTRGGSDAIIARVRIEEKPDQRSGDEKAVVDVTPRTRLARRDGTAIRAATVGDIKVGLVVEAWFTGPVRESYPVQATGAAIVIR